MAKLLLTQALAEQFAGGLLAVVRSDGEITPTESMALQAILADTLGSTTVDMSEVMFLRVTPQSLRSAITHAGGSAYRGHSVSPATEIAEAFIAAAVRVAESDNGMSSAKATLINSYAQGLGVSTRART